MRTYIEIIEMNEFIFIVFESNNFNYGTASGNDTHIGKSGVHPSYCCIPYSLHSSRMISSPQLFLIKNKFPAGIEQNESAPLVSHKYLVWDQLIPFSFQNTTCSHCYLTLTHEGYSILFLETCSLNFS